MFDIGFWELTLLAVIGLIVLGPERLPVVARTLGRWVGKARYYAHNLTSELEKEVDADTLRKEVRQAREQIEAQTHEVRESAQEAVNPFRKFLEDNEQDKHTLSDSADHKAQTPAARQDAAPDQASTKLADTPSAEADTQSTSAGSSAASESQDRTT